AMMTTGRSTGNPISFCEGVAKDPGRRLPWFCPCPPPNPPPQGGRAFLAPSPLVGEGRGGGCGDGRRHARSICQTHPRGHCPRPRGGCLDLETASRPIV